MNAGRTIAATGIALALGFCGHGFAFEPRSDQKRDRKESLAVLSRFAATFEIRLDDKQIAARGEEPAMRWTDTIGHARQRRRIVSPQGAATLPLPPCGLSTSARLREG